MVYGLSVLKTTLDCVAARAGLYRKPIFDFPPLQLGSQQDPIVVPVEEFS